MSTIALVAITMMALAAAIAVLRARSWALARARRREIARRRAALADAHRELMQQRLERAERVGRFVRDEVEEIAGRGGGAERGAVASG